MTMRQDFADQVFLAIDGDDAEAPDCIKPLSWLKSMVDACDTPEAAEVLGADDPDAWRDMVREVRQLYGKLYRARDFGRDG